MKHLPARILFEIGLLRSRVIQAGQLVSVYGEAERIRHGGPNENVALEDIVEEIMAQCSDAPGFEIDVNEAWTSLMGSTRTYH